jgi:hypothetical protein
MANCEVCLGPAERRQGRPRCSACRPIRTPVHRICTTCNVEHVSHKARCAACTAEYLRLAYRRANGIALDAGPAACCEECGGRLDSASNHRKVTMIRRYCSSACRYRAKCRRRRVARAGLPVERYAAAEVFARDEWTCQLCGEAIDRDAVPRSRGSASIDHILPVSMGGADVMSNVQAAHLSCNVAKGGANRMVA